MASYNRVILVGNLTRDPELRTTPRGTAICQFGLAVNREYKTDSGETRDDALFVDCEAWAKTAELVAKYLTKGRPALIEGRLKLDQWEDKTDGKKRSRIKVVVESVQFLGSKPDAAERADAPPANQPAQPAPKKPATENLDESVPF